MNTENKRIIDISVDSCVWVSVWQFDALVNQCRRIQPTVSQKRTGVDQVFLLQHVQFTWEISFV